MIVNNYTVKIKTGRSPVVRSIHLTAKSVAAAITAVLASHGPAKLVDAFQTY
jgi:hypothetical protein